VVQKAAGALLLTEIGNRAAIAIYYPGVAKQIGKRRIDCSENQNNPMDQLFCMRVFVRVVEHGSFARAADDLAASRSSVTTAVGQLERRLGVRLLHRTTRRLNLTDEGRAYYERCVRILEDLTEAEEALYGTRALPKGRLKVSVPQSFTHLLFFQALPGFLARHPDLSMEVVFSDRAVNLVEEGIDCAVRAVAIPDDSMLVARHIASGKRITCAAPAYLTKRGTPKTIDALAEHDCIAFISPSTGRTLDWTFDEAGQTRGHTPRGRLGVTSLEAAAAAAVAGLGIAQVPDILVFRALLAGQLRPLLLDVVAPTPSLMVVYPSNRYLTAKVRAFADFVAEWYPPQGWWPEITALVQKNREGSAQAGAGGPAKRNRNVRNRSAADAQTGSATSRPDRRRSRGRRSSSP
jgi:LysR family transcriptional regulator for bpeEF and oprC